MIQTGGDMKVREGIRRIGTALLAIILFFSASVTSVMAEESNFEQVEKKDSYIAMMNYISLVNNEINASSNNRLLLDQIYSSLMNNTAPSALDDYTQDQLNDMLLTIDEYRMIDVKRNRLEYIYEQNQAQALREAVPNPLGLISGVSSVRLSSLIASVVYMAVDSVASYNSATSQADMQFLESGWELDDDETAALNQSQEQLFNYMVNMAKKNNIPDRYVLSVDKIKEFVQYKNIDNVVRRIDYLETNQSTFEKFGEYWLTLAESYYENGEYKKCISTINKYNKLGVDIFQKDHGLAETLTMAISSVQESVSDEKKKIEDIDQYLELLKNNLETDDWSLRYFAAQTDIYLYSETHKKTYLADAYELAKNNVNYLIDKQIELNNAYLSEIEDKDIPKDATKEQKKEIKQYNKMIHNDRKTELPPAYEALYLNCDLLFSIADKLGISENKKEEMDKILHGSSKADALFLTAPLDNKYYFSDVPALDDSGIVYDKGELSVPASLVSGQSKITVTIGEGKNEKTITDWKIKEVKRKPGDAVNAMTVEYTSKESGDYDYVDHTPIKVVITPVEGEQCPDITVNFLTKSNKKLKFIENFEFERTK